VTPRGGDGSGPEPTTAQIGALRSDFHELFDAEFNYVCRVLRRLGVRPADLEDVAQDVFVSVHRRFDELDPSRGVRAWLFSFALRASANYRRLARHRREAGPPDESTRDPGPTPEDTSVQTEARARVLAALDELGFDQRVAFVMHEIEGFSAPEISSELGVPLNTVYSRLRLARSAFRQAVLRARSEATEEGR
jgi:RNA polymerase sigma-70 factor (ECF subfamily)